MTGDQIRTKFQSFDNISQGNFGEKRLASLRDLMQMKGLDVWLVPHGDEHQNEYPPEQAWRLAWLTGFTGSAGYAIITRSEAMVFVDGRYLNQVSHQIDPDQFAFVDSTTTSPDKWLKNWLGDQQTKVPKDGRTEQSLRIGFDPWLTTIAAKSGFDKALDENHASLVASHNLIDEIWHDQPGQPLEPVSIAPQEFTGELALHKIETLKQQLCDKNVDFCLLTDLTSIAWLFNIRGGDTRHTPLALGYAIIRADGYAMLFMDKRKMSREVEAYLTQLADLHPPSRFDEELAKLAEGAKVLTDFSKVSVALSDIITKNSGLLVEGTDPVALPRARKNEQEIEGSRNAHLRDGVAVTKFLYWLDQQQPGSVDEITAVEKLESMRSLCAEKFDSTLMEISFDTISGAGANGAIVHYRVNYDSNATLAENSVYLVDSGGQYEDGTTDITRTVAIGIPPQAAIEDFTLVLKGHIAIALARFPQKTRGVDIDGLARTALWRNGRDYAHGTGHGVGSYLSVHEGPQSISRRGMSELRPGMIISNEPGFYREGQYGIRIENLLLVKEPREIKGGNVAVMEFETLSIAPIDLRLVNADRLNTAELHWLNAYHGWVKRKLSPHLDEAERNWLEEATTPLSHELPAASA